MINITLKRESLITYEQANQHVWPLKATATAVGIEPEIFVYHAAVAGSPETTDVFECIASVSQMQEIPKAKPSADTPYYRTASLLFVCRSAAEADELWANILEDVQELVQNTGALAALQDEETVVIS